MRDLFFVGYLGLLLLLAFKRPVSVHAVYAYVDIIAPQRLSYFLLNSIPLSLILFGFAFAGFMLSDDKKDVRISPRWACWSLLLGLLRLYTHLTRSSRWQRRKNGHGSGKRWFLPHSCR